MNISGIEFAAAQAKQIDSNFDELHYALEATGSPFTVKERSAIENTLAERGNRYGTLLENGQVAQSIKKTMQSTPNWRLLSNDKKEALDQIASKISRILVGDPEYKDNWHDIIGYATCVEKTLE